jgi:hypothetical protein
MSEDTKNPGEEFFEVEELDDKSLEDVAGGTNSGCENGSCAGSDNSNCSNTTCFLEAQ